MLIIRLDINIINFGDIPLITKHSNIAINIKGKVLICALRFMGVQDHLAIVCHLINGEINIYHSLI